jgi:hypothetical protein
MSAVTHSIAGLCRVVALKNEVASSDLAGHPDDSPGRCTIAPARIAMEHSERIPELRCQIRIPELVPQPVDAGILS